MKQFKTTIDKGLGKIMNNISKGFDANAGKLVYPTSHSTTEKNGYLVYPVSRFYKNTIIQFDRVIGYTPRSQKQIDNEVNLTRGAYNGFMSPKTRTNVRKYLATWIDAYFSMSEYVKRTISGKPYLTFVTLTLPYTQLHSDNFIKRNYLMPFIETLKSDCKVVNYFWRAESQKNGRIHFHLIVDSYINHQDLRALWNRSLLKPFEFGNITTSYIELFETMWGHLSPNSIDITGLTGKASPSNYIMKYVCKEDGYRPIQGRIHGCSDKLRLVVPFELENDSVINSFVKSVIEIPETDVFEGDNFRVIKFKSGTLLGLPTYGVIKKQMDSYYFGVMKRLYDGKPISDVENSYIASIKSEDEPFFQPKQMELDLVYESPHEVYYSLTH